MQKYFRREVIISAVVVGGGALLFAGLFYWFVHDLTSRGEKILVDRGLIAKRAEAIGVLAQLKRDAPAATAYQKSIDLILARQDELLLDFRQWLEGLARAHSLNMTFRFQGSEVLPQENTPGYAPFILNIGGTLDNILSFTQDIEGRASRFLVSIEGFDLQEGSDGYTLSTQGRVFFR